MVNGCHCQRDACGISTHTLLAFPILELLLHFYATEIVFQLATKRDKFRNWKTTYEATVLTCVKWAEEEAVK